MTFTAIAPMLAGVFGPIMAFGLLAMWIGRSINAGFVGLFVGAIVATWMMG